MSLALNLAFDHGRAGVFDVLVEALYEKLQDDPAWRKPLPSIAGVNGKKLPPEVAAILRERLQSLQLSLAEMQHDNAALRRAWVKSVNSNKA